VYDDLVVLAYHAVSVAWPSPLAVAPAEFERQLVWLLARGYRAVTFSEAVSGATHGRRVAVTFDDAFVSVGSRARPILDRLGIPATVFAPTAFVTDPAMLRGDRWMHTPWAAEIERLSWDELRSMSESGWEVGSHTRGHPRLPELGDAALAEELRRSREDCAAAIGHCTSVAYPYGAFDARVTDAARAAGYEVGATLPARLAPMTRGDPLAHPRVGIYRRDHMGRFRAKVSPGLRRLRASPAWEPIRRAALTG
jgi:peptidoglycan/xylan/chitin deacetylase (PgdA/CDA1 family)